MGSIVVLGGSAETLGFALGGADVLPADDPDAVREAWASLKDETVVVVLTPAAAEALVEERRAGGGILTVVLPS